MYVVVRFFLKLWYAYIVRFAQHLYARTGERGTVPCGHRIKDGIRATDASTGILVHASRSECTMLPQELRRI